MPLQLPRGLVRIVAPAAEPLTLTETKEFLRITHADDDARLTDMIATARTLAEQWLRRSLVTQSWKLTFEDDISGSVRLPMGPVQSITSVTTLTSEEVSTVVSTTAYALSANRESLVVESIITGYRIEVVYVAGYGTSSQVPKPIKLGMMNHIASLYDGNIGMTPIPDDVLSCYMPYRELAL